MSAAGSAAVESRIIGSQAGGAAQEAGHMAAHDKFLLEEEEYEYAFPSPYKYPRDRSVRD